MKKSQHLAFSKFWQSAVELLWQSIKKINVNSLMFSNIYRRYNVHTGMYHGCCCCRDKRRVGGQVKVDKPEIYRDTAIRALAMSNAAFDVSYVIKSKF